MKQISSSYSYTLSLAQNGTVYANGENTDGNLGLGNTNNVYFLPTRIPGLSNIIAVSSGYQNGFALSSTGQMYGWGLNQNGEVGIGSFAQRLTPVLVSSLQGVMQVSSGRFHTVALINSTNGLSVYTWGLNTNWNLCLGTSSTGIRNTPQLVPGLNNNVNKVYALQESNIFILNQVSCFGVLDTLPSVCSGNGNCSSVNNCTCFPGWNGTSCSTATCFGRSASDPQVCSGFGNCTNINTCSCSSTRGGNNCQHAYCFGVLASNPLVCNGNGTCIGTNSCVCNANYTNSQCTTPICYGIAATTPSTCSGHGNCTAPNKCSCLASHTGSNCEIPICYGIPATSSTVCGSRGSCTGYNQCSCSGTYSGNVCQFSTCFGINSTNPLVCNSRGSCPSFNNCICNSNYTGSSCQNPICYGLSSIDPNVCSGAGRCDTPNNCTCFFSTSTGAQCEAVEFHWFGGTGFWSNMSNWKYLINGVFTNANRLPAYGDSIFIDQVGTYTVTLDTNPTLWKVNIGNPNGTSFPTFALNQRILMVNSTSILYMGASMTMKSSNLYISGEFGIFGTFTANSSTIFLSKNVEESGRVVIVNSELKGSSYSWTSRGNVSFQGTVNVYTGFLSYGDMKNLGGWTIFDSSFYSGSESTIDSVGNLMFNNGAEIASKTLIGSGSISGHVLVFNGSSSVGLALGSVSTLRFKNGITKINTLWNFTASTTVYIEQSAVVETHQQMHMFTNVFGGGKLSNYANMYLSTTSPIFNISIQLNVSNPIYCMSANYTFASPITINQGGQFIIDGFELLYFDTTVDVNVVNQVVFAGTGRVYTSTLSVMTIAGGRAVFDTPIFGNGGHLMTNGAQVYFNKDLGLISGASRVTINGGFLQSSTRLGIYNTYGIFGTGTLIVPSGAFVYASSSTLATISAPFAMSGWISVTFGTLKISLPDFTSSATLYIQNSVVEVSGGKFANRFISGGGQLKITGPTEWNALSASPVLEVTLIIDAPLTITLRNYITNYPVTVTSGSILGSGTLTIQNVMNVNSVSSSFGNINVYGTLQCNAGVQNFKKIALYGGKLLNTNSIIQIDDLIHIDSDPSNSLVGGVLSGKVTLSGRIDWFSGTIQDSSLTSGTNIRMLGSGEKSLLRSNLTLTGTGSFDFRTITVTSSRLEVYPFAKIEIFGSLELTSYDSIMINSGTIKFNVTDSQVNWNLPIINYGDFEVTGNGSVSLSSFNQFSGKFELDGSSISLPRDQTLMIQGGALSAHGTITASNVNFTSNTGVIRIKGSETLHVAGNVFFSKNATLVFGINGIDRSSHNFIRVDGLFHMDGLIYIKLGREYAKSIKIGDVVDFAQFNASMIEKVKIQLIGASYRSAKINFVQKACSLEIINSIGSVGSNNYKCHYLGDQRILEWNTFDDNSLISMTLTTPPTFGWIGFGLNSQTTSLINATMIAVSRDAIYQVFNHQNLSNSLDAYIDVGSNQINTLFAIGPTYQSISLFFPQSSLFGQSKIYYADSDIEIINNTLTKHWRTRVYDFDILNQEPTPCLNFLAPSRMEVYEIPAIVIMAFLYVVSFLLCIVFYKWQPLRSRGISPFLTLGFLFLQLMLEIRNRDYIPSFQGSLCVYLAYGFYPLQEICFVMIFLYFLRYFSIINLNYAKNHSAIESKMTLRIRILKILSSTWFVVGLLVGSFLAILLLYTVILASTGYECRFVSLILLKIINNFFLIAVYLATLILLIVDVALNWKFVVKCDWITYIWGADPHVFRVQIVLFVPFMIYNLFAEFFSLASSFEFQAIILHFRENAIFNTITFAILFLIDVLFPLVVTLFRLTRSCKKRPNKDLIESLFNNPETEKMFVDFCKKEYSVENALVYQHILLFKKKKMDPRLIYEVFLAGSDSLYEINVSLSVCRRVLKAIESGESDEHLFDEVENTVKTNLSDTFSRFQMQKEWIAWQKTNKIQQELLSK